jgi:hypothetical protein
MMMMMTMGRRRRRRSVVICTPSQTLLEGSSQGERDGRCMWLDSVFLEHGLLDGCFLKHCNEPTGNFFTSCSPELFMKDSVHWSYFVCLLRVSLFQFTFTDVCKWFCAANGRVTARFGWVNIDSNFIIWELSWLRALRSKWRDIVFVLCPVRSQYSSVIIVTRLRVGRSEFRVLAGAMEYLICRKSRPASGLPASCAVGAGLNSRASSGRGNRTNTSP